MIKVGDKLRRRALDAQASEHVTAEIHRVVDAARRVVLEG